MLQDMHNMAASWVFYVKVGTFTQLEQSKICCFNVNKSEMVRVTVQHDCNVTVSFTYYPGDFVIETSADSFSLNELRMCM
jgi:hypothetical protein